MDEPLANPRQPALVSLRAGDKVLVLLNDDPPTEVLEEILDVLHGSFEGVEFVGLSNVAGVLVKPPERKPRRPSSDEPAPGPTPSAPAEPAD